jgi:hypothetical protein
MREKEREK